MSAGNDYLEVLLQAILEELQGLRADLREGQSEPLAPLTRVVEAFTEDMSPARTAAAVTDDAPPPETAGEPPVNEVVEFLQSRGVEVKSWRNGQPADDVYDWLATFMGTRFENLRRLHTTIRQHLSGAPRFSLPLRDRPAQEITDCTNFCVKLHELAFLTDYQYNRAARTIYASVHQTGRVINFFTGGWFEHYVSLVVNQAVAAKDDSAQSLRNLILRWPDGQDGELDLFFLIAGEPLWVECKTGDYQAHLVKYSRLRSMMGIPASRALLVLLDLSDSLLVNLNRLYDLRVANLTSLNSALDEALGQLPAGSASFG